MRQGWNSVVYIRKVFSDWAALGALWQKKQHGAWSLNAGLNFRHSGYEFLTR